MTRVFIHPHAGVLSAYGMGLADQTVMRERAVEAKLDAPDVLEEVTEELASAAREELVRQGASAERIRLERRAHLKYDGTDTALIVALGPRERMVADFEAAYRKQFSFLMPGRAFVAEAVSVEAIAPGDAPRETPPDSRPRAEPVRRGRRAGRRPVPGPAPSPSGGCACSAPGAGTKRRSIVEKRSPPDRRSAGRRSSPRGKRPPGVSRKGRATRRRPTTLW